MGETEQESGRNAQGYLESILTGFGKQTFCANVMSPTECDAHF